MPTTAELLPGGTGGVGPAATTMIPAIIPTATFNNPRTGRRTPPRDGTLGTGATDEEAAPADADL